MDEGGWHRLVPAPFELRVRLVLPRLPGQFARLKGCSRLKESCATWLSSSSIAAKA